MRKSTIFISSLLTTFALVMLYGVVKAYQNNAVIKAAQTAAQPVVATVVPTDVPTATPSVITPEEAAQLAAQVVGHDNLLSAETSTFNSVPAYLITFTNKDVVYVGLDGQILAVQVAPMYVNLAPEPKKKNNNNDQQQDNSQPAETEHEEHDN